ncbi:MAG: D-lactate dehydrogenase [Hyphomonadaceae bacterium]
MDNPDNTSFFKLLETAVGRRNVLTSERRLKPYRTGYRMGQGKALAAILPRTLVAFWRALKICIEQDKIVIMQAANTGLNGGSTPSGDDYDRDIVIINTLKLDKIVLLNEGHQVLGFAGSTLYKLEEALEGINRSPHSIIGSSCIGASIVGGVCNNSGGSLVNRGPAYSELSLFAQVDETGELSLVNHLDIDLGDDPEDMLRNLEEGRFERNPGPSNRLASDTEYGDRVRDIAADSPARFNADKRRLYEASGCAGKLAVFAVRLDTFAAPEREQVFYIGTNDPTRLTALRKRILSEFDELPELGEYMHKSYFDAADKYCKDTYLLIKLLGTAFLPKLFAFKARVDGYLGQVPFLPDKFVDRFLQAAAKLWPDHLPKRIRAFSNKFEHQLMIKANDKSIDPLNALLAELFVDEADGEFFLCTKKEGDGALLHRFVAGGASVRYAIIHKKEVGGLMPFDIALRRNDDDWHVPLPPELHDQLAGPFILSHFFCHVFHHDFVVKKGVDVEKLKAQLTERLEQRGAKYPAEHNVGHLYYAETDLRNFYQSLDPTNAFNPGIGKTSKHRNYV